MSRRGRVGIAAAAAMAVGAVAVGGAGAASRSGDEQALQWQRPGGDRGIEQRVDRLLRQMTLKEKLQQLTLLSDGQMKDNPGEAAAGVGSVFSETDPVLIDKYQHDAVEK